MKIRHLVALGLSAIISQNVIAESGDPINGKTLSQTCAACHSVDGNSVNPVWPKLAGQHAAYIAKQLLDFKEGKRTNAQMTGMVANLSESDMQDLGAYFSSQKIKTGTTNPDMLEIGQMLYRAGDSENGVPACMACHGPAGKGNPGAMYPALAGQHAEYTVLQLNAFKTGERSNDANAVMQSIAKQMSEEQIDAISNYIQGLH